MKIYKFKKLIILTSVFLIGCTPFQVPKYNNTTLNPVVEDNVTLFPVASATISIQSYGDLAFLKYKNSPFNVAYANFPQGSATINVTYNNPSVVTFTIDTSELGNNIVVNGDYLELGTVELNTFDDNTLRVCTGVGAPANKCNRLYIRVFTLGTATGGITGTAGFINTDHVYGIDLLAGNVVTPIGFNASATAASVTNAAVVYSYTIPGNKQRIRLNDLNMPATMIKADISNAGSGNYEANIVVQYALGYVP